ncbi:MAG: hypothetical protein FJ148_05120 [Deltaproteobacteria bacterium]|nr:hypothetical protein [Deltaproteobacteria bacterium]
MSFCNGANDHRNHDAQRAELLELAAQSGEKGFSAIVRDAIDHYVEERLGRRDLVTRALQTLGTLDDEAASALERSVRDLRGTRR